MKKEENIKKGRGAQISIENPFFKHVYEAYYDDLRNEDTSSKLKTSYIQVFPKTIVNKVTSPDISMMYSMNPYQGCEHGCIYCYARNSHTYWGYDAALDFESKILVKKDAARLLKVQLLKKSWKAHPIMLSGNTDCYQPIEQKLKITRSILEVFNTYKHPVGLITKNALVTRDLDIIRQLAADNLVRVMISITSLKEDIRRKLEPRTSSAKNKLKAIETLANNNIPVGVMIAPIIPAINDTEIMDIAKAASSAGALIMGNTLVRLNGQIGIVFKDWVSKQFPERAEKVLNKIAECHNGNLNDSRFGIRMKGDGHYAKSIQSIVQIARTKYFSSVKLPPLNTKLFEQFKNGQLSLF